MEFDKGLINFKANLKIYYTYTSEKTLALIERIKMTEHLYMILIALVIGVLSGFGAIAIRMLIKEISSISFTGDGSLLENIINSPWYIKLLIPALGGLIVGPLIYYFAPEAKGHGVPEVMQAVLLRGGRIRPRVAAIKALASSVTIGTGGSVGREGPIIQIGASIGSTVGQFLKIPSRRLKTVVGCGAAAGIAAAFNAPIAGALFAVEIILMDFAIAQFSPIVIASVMATVISHAFEGDFAAFQTPAFNLINPIEVFFYLVLGLFAGVASWIFIKVLYYIEDFWEKKVLIKDYYKAAIGGLMIGSIALLFPQIMGIGYDTINIALNGQSIWYIAILLIFVKIFATSITLGSGGSGGIFAPSLFIGAMLGVSFGIFVNDLFPQFTAAPGAYALIAMGGLVAGTTRAPITAILIVFELTKDQNVILPLMITCIISTIVSSKLSRESIYTLKLLLRNINIKDRAEVNILKSIKINDIYNKEFISLPENKKFNEIVGTLISLKVPYLTVHDSKLDILGIISIHHIKDIIFEKEDLQNICIAGDICDHNILTADINDDCKTILEKMDRCGYDGLPVVTAANPNRQIGIIWRKDIDNAYRGQLEYQEMASDLADKISVANIEKDVRFREGYIITEMAAPEKFIGASIGELNVRANYGVEIITIKNAGDINNFKKSGQQLSVIPQSNYKFSQNDILIIAGRAKDVNKLKQI